MKIAVLDKQTLTDGDISLNVFENFGEVEYAKTLKGNELIGFIKDKDAVLLNRSILTSDILKECSNLKYVGVFATGYNNVDCSKTSSFIYRLRLLIEEGFFKENKIDKVFVFGGTNDNWANAPLGEMKWDGWKEEDLYSVLPAICYFMNLLRETLPQAKIYCLINTELKPEIFDCLKKASLHNKITPVDFAEIDKRGGHPTVKGMKDIKDIVLKCL